MAALWSEEAKLGALARGRARRLPGLGGRGVIPAEDLAKIESGAGFWVERTQEIERATNHDVIAFLTDVAERVGPASRWVHYGMTSSDMVDTGLALAIAAGRRAAARRPGGAHPRAARPGARARGHALRGPHPRRARRAHDLRAQAGRLRLREPPQRGSPARRAQGASVGKLSGAVGTYATLAPDLEAEVLAALGLGCEPVATQVVARDRHAALVAQMAVAASSLDRLATELRHLQRTEVREAEEAFAAGQKGSSAMPHKRNPITAERISGLARVIRGHAVAALEDVALWHERDISHSSVERVVLPDAFCLLDYLLHRRGRSSRGSW